MGSLGEDAFEIGISFFGDLHYKIIETSLLFLHRLLRYH